MIDYQSARLHMVESQIRPNKVTDPTVIEALLAVPRERFVPEHLRGVAYIDEDVPLGGGRYLIEPMVFGRILQLAAIKASDVVLEIGCATGYASAVLARLAQRVVALEDDHAMATRATATLQALGVANATVVEGALATGYPQRAPYDVILFGGAVAAVPAAILEQLAEGGRLVVVEKRQPGMGKVAMVSRLGGVLGRRIMFDAGTPMLASFAAQPSFAF